ncbi:RlmE family RNA methyltransferase [Sulfurirhabdus autotrophica]|uniref:Ribosomal RNA large subunit methyltransferase E n=1 Tax=Sulfurirhabdus autotrophica TaxID=1706046 RepID=A0A4R3YJE0_9PROT|nr:RlmE family RNA methyltransferase [Sulfurirhabdus autotrophica]TCV90833.1 23S rRNA Um-2552 2'-O-methyltransferase [Sulfurirhabdus autotrophica]
MKRTKTSKAWMREHINDPYVKLAKQEGYRSRAAFKLLDIDERDNLFRSGMVVVDLGATPGGWSQVVAQKVGSSGKVIALDILEMSPPAGVTFIQGDFREDAVLAQLADALQGKQVDLVISDMSPNISGIGLSDQARSMHLVELAMDFAVNYLKPEGVFLAKVFQGVGFEEFVQTMRANFKQVQTRKPKASRDRSSELYLLGKELKGESA